jgi:hypothetical protein
VFQVLVLHVPCAPSSFKIFHQVLTEPTAAAVMALTKVAQQQKQTLPKSTE